MQETKTESRKAADDEETIGQARYSATETSASKANIEPRKPSSETSNKPKSSPGQGDPKESASDSRPRGRPQYRPGTLMAQMVEQLKKPQIPQKSIKPQKQRKLTKNQKDYIAAAYATLRGDNKRLASQLVWDGAPQLRVSERVPIPPLNRVTNIWKEPSREWNGGRY